MDPSYDNLKWWKKAVVFLVGLGLTGCGGVAVVRDVEVGVVLVIIGLIVVISPDKIVPIIQDVCHVGGRTDRPLLST